MRLPRASRLAVLGAVGSVVASCTLFNPLDRYQAGLDSPPGEDGASGGDANGGTDDGGPGSRDGSPNPPDPSRCDPTKPFGTPTPITELNSADANLLADVSADELTAYLSSNRTGGGVHLFYATRTDRDGTWSTPEELFPKGAYDDWSVAVSPLATIAVLASGRGGTNIDLYVASRDNAFQTFGVPMTATSINSAANEQSPHWTADGKTLYFDSTRGGRREIYRSPVAGSTFGAPVAVTELNGSFNSAVPVLTKDELTIYFCSNRPPTPPGDECDIYAATRTKQSDPFSNIQRVESLTSPMVDAPNHITEDGCRLYMSSERGGKFDIYLAERPRR